MEPKYELNKSKVCTKDNNFHNKIDDQISWNRKTISMHAPILSNFIFTFLVLCKLCRFRNPAKETLKSPTFNISHTKSTIFFVD